MLDLRFPIFTAFFFDCKPFTSTFPLVILNLEIRFFSGFYIFKSFASSSKLLNAVTSVQAGAVTASGTAGLPGIPALVEKLQARGCDVFLVSGGFRDIINPVAKTLGIPLDHVFANRILFKVRPSRSPRG